MQLSSLHVVVQIVGVVPGLVDDRLLRDVAA
jgi:hypothetical protein